MNIQIECEGDQEEDILEHRKIEYPHLLKSSMATYFLQVAKDARIRDKQIRGNSEKS